MKLTAEMLHFRYDGVPEWWDMSEVVDNYERSLEEYEWLLLIVDRAMKFTIEVIVSEEDLSSTGTTYEKRIV